MPDMIDPDLSALLGDDPEELPAGGGPGNMAMPDFKSLFGGGRGPEEGPEEGGEFGVDLTRKTLQEPARYEEERPGDYFSDPDYYKQALGGEGEEAQKLHEILSKYLKAQDPKDRGVYRQQLVPAFWYLAAKVALHASSSSAPLPKRLLLRFGALLPSLLSPELRDTVQRVVFEKEIDEPVYYVDEWIRAVASGQVKASATDEVKSSRSGDDRAKVDAAIQRAQGRRDAAAGIMKAKAEERRSLEGLLRGRVEELGRHAELESALNLPAPYTEAQRKGATEIMELLRRLMAADKSLAASMGEFRAASEELAAARDRARGAEAGEAKADLQAVAQEFETVRQMTKLCIGRQGNHFPLLSREYCRASIRDLGTRENVVKAMAWIESIDSEAYCRPYRNALNRIVPFVVILPCYGDFGICWEPFDRYNRASSRGRLAVPLYPKSIREALIYAVADLRWQVAKEKASYYWMEEGLTGNYYQWFTSKKIKGDVKEYFIQDYIVWITKESEGIQKLDKEVRAIFWRYLPFQQAIKDKLKTRSYIYQELYQKDVNRSLSDGY